MFINGKILTEEDFNLLILKIDKKLKPLKEFTSPTYQGNGIPTTDGLFVLLKPKQQVFIDALKPLKINWVEINPSEIKREEI